MCYDRAVRIFDRMSLTLPHFYATKKFNNNDFPAEQRAQSAVKKKGHKIQRWKHEDGIVL